jgi:hypothetical protein
MHGKDGAKGDIGKSGQDGKDGKDGIDGKDGKQGKDGKIGKDGVSVVDTWIAADNHLVVKLSNGKEIDAGAIDGVGKSGMQINTQLANPQIIVSAVAPSNPSLNDLWLQI